MEFLYYNDRYDAPISIEVTAKMTEVGTSSRLYYLIWRNSINHSGLLIKTKNVKDFIQRHNLVFIGEV